MFTAFLLTQNCSAFSFGKYANDALRRLPWKPRAFQLHGRGFLDCIQAPETLEQHLSPVGAYSRYGVQRRGEKRGPVHVLVVRDGEPVGLVTYSLEQVENVRIPVQEKGILAAGQINFFI